MMEFSYLPEEIILKVVSFLNPTDILQSICLLSKKFKAISNEEVIEVTKSFVIIL